MTESEVIKICNTIIFASSLSNPQGAALNTTKDELAEAMRMAIQALEKQVPMKVKNSGERIPFEWYCTACGELLCDDGYKDTYIKYCEHCGQKLDWSDEE